jgi:valyl-tRNA synthetase
MSGRDILFFWDARMIMSALELVGDVPFRTLVLHGLVRDAQGRKLSKSLGNSPDPLDLFDRYGTDAVRVAIALNYPMGRQDTRLSEEIFKNGQGLVIKLWNATKLFLGNLGEEGLSFDSRAMNLTALEDRWIVSRLGEAVRAHDSYLEKNDVVHACGAVNTFFWDDYCDWYLEIVKPRLWGEGESKRTALAVAALCERTLLKLLHPYMPFVTEELWQVLKTRGVVDKGDEGDQRSICVASWPEAELLAKDSAAEAQIDLMSSLVRGIRDIRQNLNISAKAPLKVRMLFLNDSARGNFEPVRSVAQSIGAVEAFSDHTGEGTPAGHVPLKFNGGIGYVQVPSDVDVKEITSKLSVRIEKLEKQLAGVERNLANSEFVANAPAALVEETRGKASELRESIARLDEFRKSLQ